VLDERELRSQKDLGIRDRNDDALGPPPKAGGIRHNHGGSSSLPGPGSWAWMRSEPDGCSHLRGTRFSTPHASQDYPSGIGERVPGATLAPSSGSTARAHAGTVTAGGNEPTERGSAGNHGQIL
jgi:hypothetical protein